MKVLKFGGTSVGSAQRMKDVAKLITETVRSLYCQPCRVQPTR